MNCEDGALSPEFLFMGQYYLLRVEMRRTSLAYAGGSKVGDTIYLNLARLVVTKNGKGPLLSR